MPPRLVEPAVGLAGTDGERPLAREEEDEGEGWDVGGPEPLAPAGHPGRAGPEEEGHVGSDGEGDLAQGPPVGRRKGAGQAAQDRGGVGGATAQAGDDGGALLDLDGEAAPDAEAGPECLGRSGGQVRGPVELGEARDATGDRPGPGRDAHLHPVAEVERGQEAEDLVVAVGPLRADAEDEVHLGRGEGDKAHGPTSTTPRRPPAAGARIARAPLAGKLYAPAPCATEATTTSITR